MNKKLSMLYALMLALFMGMASVACDKTDPEPVTSGKLEVENDSHEFIFGYEATGAQLKFTAPGAWKIQLPAQVDWIYVSPAAGKAGKTGVEVKVGKNTLQTVREASFDLVCGSEKVSFTVKQAKFGGSVNDLVNPENRNIDPATIPNYDKFFSNSEHGKGILNASSRFSFAHYKQSEHFFVFWDKKFGDDPGASSVPSNMRVNIDDLLAKAEKFFDTNVNKLHMATLGQGKSQLDRYKMQIYLLYQEEWLATGSGYDNTIGALWVNPSTCQPVGSTIAHEVGHSFQYQVYCDQLLQGAANNMKHGFRYGFSSDGSGGCSFWEQCAQWQSFCDYPSEIFGYHLGVWQANYHRIFYHEWMRYASYWLQYYWADKHGIDALQRVWRESSFPQDPIEAYTAIYNGGDMQKTYDELYDYASRMVYYDIPGVKNYATSAAKGAYSTSLFRVEGTKYQIGYQSTPGTAGFNVIRLNTSAGKEVSVDFKALTPGSELASKDPGKQLDADGKVKARVTTYNKQSNQSTGFRLGFVSIVGGVPQYSPMTKGTDMTAKYSVPSNASELYLVVLASPAKYNRVPWDDNEANDEQWPYTVTIGNSDVYGYTEPSVPVFTKVDENTLKVTYDLTVNPDNGDWNAGSLDLACSQVAEFTGIALSNLADAVVPVKLNEAVTKKEGKIVMFNRNADGTLANTPTANLGYWVTANGTCADYNSATIYYELGGLNLTLGKKGKVGTAGQSMVMHPVFVYTKNGKDKNIEVTVNYRFSNPAASSRRRSAPIVRNKPF